MVQGIVDGVRAFAERASKWICATTEAQKRVYVFYGEVYGGKGISGASKFYSKSGQEVGFRLFDILSFKTEDFISKIQEPREKISSWRKHLGQPFVDEPYLRAYASTLDVEVTPRILLGTPPPSGVTEAHEWLKMVLKDGSRAILGETGKGRPEGVVVRTVDRWKIAKLRFEDYERTHRL